MWWLVAGGVLVVAGGLLTWRASAGPAGPPRGIAVALGVALVFWGLVSAVVGVIVTTL
ncbi:MAG: hypothetical protein FWF90_15895 [Promicromonosporaceae bacterium]|nr:hypothetical protein [Promicromonosporaceae bacterium]